MKKVFDFNSSMKRSHIIGKPRELAWPCEMFRVTLPVQNNSRRDLNVFETCVLKLLSYRFYEPKELAEETCLPPEFIETVLLRLYDLGKIDEHYQLRPEALAELARSADMESDIQYETYVVFRERIGGRLLPEIVPAYQLKSEEIVESDKKYAIKKGKEIDYLSRLEDKQVGSAGSPFRQSIRPTPGDVLSIVRKRKRIRLSQDSFRISISPDSEPCDLRVRLIMQDNKTVDWRICNPFGSGWSLELEASYKQLLDTSEKEGAQLHNWMIFNKDTSKLLRREKDERQPEPFETPENGKLYPELLAALTREEKEKDVHAVLEWTLYYALKEVDTKKSIQMLSLEMRDNLEKAIDAFIMEEPRKDNKQSVRPEIKKRIPIPNSRKLQSFRNDEVAEMQTVLPIALLVSQDDPNFRFHRVFQKYPDCLKRLLDLKERRDAVRHGRSRWTEIYGEDDYSFMKDFVNTMIPSFRFVDSADAPEEKIETVFDSRLSARIKLQDAFGVSAFDRMDSVLQENLLQAEMFRQRVCPENDPGANTEGKNERSEPRERVDVLWGVRPLYTAVQCAFRPHLIGARPESSTIEYANRKAEKNQLGVLPESLQTVRSEMLLRTLDGDDQTLGASVLAWILLSDESTLRIVAAKLPTFLEIIDNILVKNSHANQICMMTGKEFNAFAQTTYQLIKTISEV